MGGTSTDVSLIEDGRPKLAGEIEVHGYPLKTPALDIHTVGAGGGSIAHVDAGGLLKVGPRSAGAVPGPVCYGLGNEEPTVTDANVVLQTLNPTHLLGGRMADRPRSGPRRRSRGSAERLGLDVMATAQGIVSVVTANMAKAIRVISVQRGHDPRDYTLVAFGGAGPLHAARLARELEIPRVLVPRHPGILCALGLLLSDLKTNYAQTRLMPATDGVAAPDGRDVRGARAPRRRLVRRAKASRPARARSGARSTCATPARTTSCPCPFPTRRRGRALLEDARRPASSAPTSRCTATSPPRSRSRRSRSGSRRWAPCAAPRSARIRPPPTDATARDRGRARRLARRGGRMSSRAPSTIASGSRPATASRARPSSSRWTRRRCCCPARRRAVDPYLNLIIEGWTERDPGTTRPHAAGGRPAVDPITVEVIGNALSSIVEEMGETLVRAAYSTNVKERRDSSTCLFDARGRTLCQAMHIPMHLGSLIGVVEHVIARHPLAAIREGDVFIGNDAYTGGGTHLPDIVMIEPIFVDGGIVAWATNIAHHADFVDRGHAHIYQEGLRIPPVRLYREGQLPAGRARPDPAQLPGAARAAATTCARRWRPTARASSASSSLCAQARSRPGAGGGRGAPRLHRAPDARRHRHHPIRHLRRSRTGSTPTRSRTRRSSPSASRSRGTRSLYASTAPRRCARGSTSCGRGSWRPSTTR